MKAVSALLFAGCLFIAGCIGYELHQPEPDVFYEPIIREIPPPLTQHHDYMRST